LVHRNIPYIMKFARENSKILKHVSAKAEMKLAI
jgi:hypothetical protein